MVDRLKAFGLMSEIISWKLRLFVPTGASGPEITVPRESGDRAAA